MRSRVVRVRDLSASEIGAWEELGRHAVEPNPLFEPGCLLPAVEHLPNGSAIHMVLAEEHGEFVGCFPLEPARRGRDRMPLTLLEHLRPTWTTQVRRNRYDLTPLLRADRAEEAMQTLLQATAKDGTPRAPNLVRFEALSADGPVEASLRASARTLRVPLYTAESWTRPVAHRHGDGEYRRGSDSRRKNVRELQRKQRRLGELLGGPVALVDRSDDASVIGEVLELESSGYKFATGVAMVSWPGETEWFCATCDAFRKSERLVVCTLEAAGRVVAAVVWLRGGDRLFGLQRIYDEQLKQFSPGSMLDLLFFDRFHKMDGIEMLDSCTGAHMERAIGLYDESRPVVTVVAAVGGPLDRRVLLPFGAARSVLAPRERVRKLIARSKPLERLIQHASTRARSSRFSTRDPAQTSPLGVGGAPTDT